MYHRFDVEILIDDGGDYSAEIDNYNDNGNVPRLDPDPSYWDFAQLTEAVGRGFVEVVKMDHVRASRN